MDGAPGGVEDGALEHLLTLLTPLDGLVDVGVVVVLVVVLDGKQRVKEDVHGRGPDRGTEPGYKEDHPDLGSLGEGVGVLELIELHDDGAGGHRGLELPGQTLLRLENVSPVTAVLFLQDDGQRFSQVDPEQRRFYQ